MRTPQMGLRVVGLLLLLSSFGTAEARSVTQTRTLGWQRRIGWDGKKNKLPNRRDPKGSPTEPKRGLGFPNLFGNKKKADEKNKDSTRNKPAVKGQPKRQDRRDSNSQGNNGGNDKENVGLSISIGSMTEGSRSKPIALGPLIQAVSRLGVVSLVTKLLALDSEKKRPEQHFTWESLNERYSRDDAVLGRVLKAAPSEFAPTTLLSRFLEKWHAVLVSIQGKKQDEDEVVVPPSPPPPNVVVVDVTPSEGLNVDHLSDVINFLTSAQARGLLGSDLEVVLLIKSPGGEVTKFGLAAAQVARLNQVGINVTVCIDSVAASGGYLMAAQARTIVAAPFAVVGSIGVYMEALNFNKLLTDVGIRPMVIKAGQHKNPLTPFGPVTEKDLRAETERLEGVHQSIVDICLQQRPDIDPSICDGTILVGARAVEQGLVDRLLTSEEYIAERIQEGANVLKLHRLSHRHSSHMSIARALEVVPHMTRRLVKLEPQQVAATIVHGVAALRISQQILEILSSGRL